MQEKNSRSEISSIKFCWDENVAFNDFTLWSKQQNGTPSVKYSTAHPNFPIVFSSFYLQLQIASDDL